MGIHLKLLKATDEGFRKAMAELKPVTEFNAELRMIASEMIRVMCHERGLGLVGPQVGIPLKIAVMNAGLDHGFHNAARDLKMTNPEVAWAGPQVTVEDESSLSARGVMVSKARPTKIKARWIDIKTGEIRQRDMEGREARVFCHLVDQLEARWLPAEPDVKALTESERNMFESLRGGVLPKLQQLNR